MRLFRITEVILKPFGKLIGRHCHGLHIQNPSQLWYFFDLRMVLLIYTHKRSLTLVESKVCAY